MEVEDIEFFSNNNLMRCVQLVCLIYLTWKEFVMDEYVYIYVMNEHTLQYITFKY